eukprot:CAMPEP_0176136786 /NCGR_PEP_ID=MMETSP0120_2-20121206/69426_1 /TAXON_ID=160619 /ORGANISM="Kryptoperidinium foliaceum, Strain CCMP 1326" /LENGTH=53 /DNA_ID=CAMNT_0017472585 /DNA_START=48 /DNA_END=206 /DNA_ORIENTATION=-
MPQLLGRDKPPEYRERDFSAEAGGRVEFQRRGHVGAAELSHDEKRSGWRATAL